jgi:hypothetical protein
MIKWLNSLAAALFVWALVFAPAFHRLGGHAEHACAACAHAAHADCGKSGHDHHPPPAKHDAAHCPICQLAATPALAAAPVVVLVPEPAPLPLPDYSFLAPAVPAAFRLPFSCGPPA